MSDINIRTEVHLGAQGRLVIPAELRPRLDLHEGDRLVARIEEGRLIVEKAEVTRQRLKARYTGLNKRSLADELIVERKEESRRESAG